MLQTWLHRPSTTSTASTVTVAVDYLGPRLTTTGLDRTAIDQRLATVIGDYTTVPEDLRGYLPAGRNRHVLRR